MKKIYQTPQTLIIKTEVQQMLCSSSFRADGDNIKVRLSSGEGDFGDNNTIGVKRNYRNSVTWDDWE